MPRNTKQKAEQNNTTRVLNVRPDTLDFRDRMYVPTLIEVPTHVPLSRFLEHEVPILDQGSEGACTGFGLATVANYLLKSRKVVPDVTPVSPRMLYEMARRHDEWPGEDYDGSSARGAMKGWHKHGVCSQEHWPYAAGRQRERLNNARTADALKRPLGAYFRVNHKDLVAMHAAIAEVGILYATALVHEGWNAPKADGLIKQSATKLGGHAFAIVAYDEQGFWIQNSWGSDWGKDGFGCISYDDWLENGTDVWVARLGAPVVLRNSLATALAHSAAAAQSNSYSYSDLRPHIISIGNDGRLKPGGDYGTSAEELETLFGEDIPFAIDECGYKHLLLYAHGGLVDATSAVQRLADYRPHMLKAGIYPLSFIWHTDFWTTASNILQDALRRRRPEGPLDTAKDFMLNRLDDALEPVARTLGGKAAWDEMKENALQASDRKDGGARLAVAHLVKLLARYPELKLHVVAHSAGSIFLAPVLSELVRREIPIESVALWAPACTIDLFKKHYLPAIDSGMVGRSALFVLSDAKEQDDHCAHIYNKSLLYLVSNAFEKNPRIPVFRNGDGEALLGMQKFVERDTDLQALIKARKLDLVLAPNSEPEGSVIASGSTAHGDFDDDAATLKATMRRMLGGKASLGAVEMKFQRSGASFKGQRRQVEATTRN